jgi:predicted dehydrogenase
MYLPTRWRSWLDFGTGVLGDHGPHYIDVAVLALGLEFPETIEADTDPEYDPEKNTQTYPRMATVRYTFPARGKKPPVTMTWHAGSAPPLPSYIKEDQLHTGGGMLVGVKGTILFGPIYTGKPGETVAELVKLLPEELDRSYKRPAKTLARPKSHWLEWTECAKSGKQPSTEFQYGGVLTQIALLGDIAIRNKGTLLRFDRKSGKFLNNDRANRAIGHFSRPGWQLPV